MLDTKTIEEETKQLLDNTVKLLSDKKAVDLVEYDLRELEHAVADHFIICSGTSSTHIKSMADALYKGNRKEIKVSPWHIEGMDNSEWVLLDYVDVVVHIFNEEMRKFYNLEDLWADAKINRFND